MPQEDLKNFMNSSSQDIANRVIQKQQGQFAGGDIGPGLSKKESYSQFMHMDADQIANHIQKKYNLFLPEPPKIEPSELDLSGYNPDLVKFNMQRNFEAANAKPDLPPYASGGPREVVGPAGPPGTADRIDTLSVPLETPKPQPPEYKGQMTWDEQGRIVPFTGPKRTYRGPNGPTIAPFAGGGPPAQQPEYQVDPWEARRQLDTQARVPTRTEKFFDFFGQPAIRGANTLAWGVPAIVNKVLFHEDLPAPLTAASSISGSLGDLAGLIGPGKVLTGAANQMTAVNKILGKSFLPKRAINFTGNLLRQAASPADVLHGVGEFLGQWFPKTAEGELLKRMTSSTISMAGIYAIGSNEGENVGEIMLNKLRSMPQGALAGQIFNIASLARFSKLHPATGWLIRAGATNVALDLLHGTRPWDERSLMDKFYSYGLNAIFTRPGTAMSLNDMRVREKFAERASKLRKEAVAIDKAFEQDGLEPVAKSALEDALRKHAESMNQPVPPPAGTPELEFMQNVQRISGEQVSEKADLSNLPDVELKKIEANDVKDQSFRDAATAELDKRYAARGPMPVEQQGKGTPMFKVGDNVVYQEMRVDENGNTSWNPKQGKVTFVSKNPLTGENAYQIQGRTAHLAESDIQYPENPQSKVRRAAPAPAPAPVRPAPAPAPAPVATETFPERAPAPRRRVKTRVVPKEDGSVEVTAETEDIPEFAPIQAKAETLRHIIDNPEIYDADVRAKAEAEMARRGKPIEVPATAPVVAEETGLPTRVTEEAFPTKRAKAPVVTSPLQPAENARFVEEEVRGQRTTERVRQKGVYSKKTWNAQNLIDYHMTEEGMDKNAAKVAGRKAYAKYKGDHKWESLINDTTRKRYGGGTKGGGPAQNPPPEAPPRPATGKTGPPPSPSTGAESPAFPTRSGAKVVRDLALESQRAAGFDPKWPFIPADLSNADFLKAIATDPGTTRVFKEKVFAAGKNLGVIPKSATIESVAGTKKSPPARVESRGVEEVFPTEETGPEVEERATEYVKPAAPTLNPNEVVKVKGEDYWGPVVEGGVPAEHEILKSGDIWTRPGKGKGNRVKIVTPDTDKPWFADVKGDADAQLRYTNVYDLWKDGFRPSGFKGKGKTYGRVTSPRPARFLVGPEGLPPGIKPEATPRRGTNKVLSREARLEAARINQERNAPPVEPREEVFPTRGRPGAGGQEITATSEFGEVEQAPLTRNYQDLYRDVREDPRYEKDSEKVVTYLDDQLDKSLGEGRRTKAGSYLAPQVREDIKDKVHDMFVENFDPSKAKEDNLKEAVRNYVKTTVNHEIERHVKSLAEGEQRFIEPGDVSGEGGELELGELEFREGQNAFMLSPGETPGKYEGLKTNEEILEEEAHAVDTNGSPRQKLARQAFVDVRKKIPMALQETFNKYVEAIELMPEGETLSTRGFGRMTGIPDRSSARYISQFRDAIRETVRNNPEYYDAFEKEAQLIDEYWKRLEDQRKDYRARERDAFESEQGVLYQADVDDRYFDAFVKAMTHFPEVGEAGTQAGVPFDDFYRVRPDVNLNRKTVKVAETPETQRVNELNRPVIARPHERGFIGNPDAEPLTFSRLRQAIREMNRPKAGHVTFPELRELINKMRDWGDIHVLENVKKGGKFFHDLGRMPFYNEKMHNLSNTLLDVEGIGSVGTEKAYRQSRDFFTMSKDEKTRTWKALELEDLTESYITNPNSKASVKLRAEGITLTPREKHGYTAMRKALDFVVTDFMPGLMKKSGFTTHEIAQIVQENYRDGYLPHFRYGDHVLSYLSPVKGERGIRYRRFVESYETERLRDVREAELKQQGWRGKDGRRHPYEFTKFRFSDVKLDPNSFVALMEHWPIAQRMFAKAAHTANDEAAIKLIERMARETIEGNYAKGRFAQRKGRMGWSNDYERAVKDYFDHVPFSIARRYMRGAIEDEIAKLPTASDKGYGRDLYNFWAGANKGGLDSEGKPTQYVRKFIYDYYLMLKPSFMLQNLTQRFGTHLPLAIAEAKRNKDAGTPGKGGAAASLEGQKLELDIYRRAMGNIGSGREVSVEQAIKQNPNFTKIEKNVLQRLIDSHELGALRTRESVGRSFADIRLGKAGFTKYLPSIEIFGILSEKSNRLHSAITAMKLNEHLGLNTNQLYEKTTDFIRRADFPYSKATRQKIARGFIGSNMFVFKSYLQNYAFGLMPYLYHNDKKAALTASVIFLGLAGAMGVPGYGLLRKGIKAILPGTDLEKEKKISQYEDAFDTTLGGTLAHGIPALVGVDGSSWFGFPDLLSAVPVTFSENIKTNLLTRLLNNDGSLDWQEAITRLAPAYFKHYFRMHQMNATGSISTDRYGAPTVTAQDIQKFSSTVKQWCMDEYHKLPTPETMSELEKALYTVVGTPSLTASRYYNKVERIKAMGKESREAAGEYNRSMANLFIDNMGGQYIADEVQKWQTDDFGANFWNMVKTWPQESQDELNALIEDAKKSGWKFNMTSVLGSIQERLERVRRK